MSIWSTLAKIGGAVAAPFTGGLSAWLPAAIGAGSGVASGLLARGGGGGGSSQKFKDQTQQMVTDIYGRHTNLGGQLERGAGALGQTGRTPEYMNRLQGLIGKPAGFSPGVTGDIANLPTTRGPQFGGLLQGLIGKQTYSPQLHETYGDLMTQGLSPGTRSAISQESQATLDPTFSGARQGITRLATMTGRNDAGIPAALADLGREEGRARAEIQRRNAIDFDAEDLRRRLIGAEGTLGLEQGERGMAERTLGLTGEASDEEMRRRMARLGLQTGAEQYARQGEVQNLGLAGEPQEFQLRNMLASLGLLEDKYSRDAGLLSSMTGSRASMEQPSIWRSIIPALISGGAQIGGELLNRRSGFGPTPVPTFGGGGGTYSGPATTGFGDAGAQNPISIPQREFFGFDPYDIGGGGLGQAPTSLMAPPNIGNAGLFIGPDGQPLLNGRPLPRMMQSY